jgi:hypothetical protein
MELWAAASQRSVGRAWRAADNAAPAASTGTTTNTTRDAGATSKARNTTAPISAATAAPANALRDRTRSVVRRALIEDTSAASARNISRYEAR